MSGLSSSPQPNDSGLSAGLDAPAELDDFALQHWRRLITSMRQKLQLLPDKPAETHTSTLRALWHLAAGQRRSIEVARLELLPRLDAAGINRLEELIDRRCRGVPLAHLTERQAFMGLEMIAGPGALIPRRETELLARRALDTALGATRMAIAIDVCTGSANIAAVLAHHLPNLQVHAADLSSDAIALARLNLAHLGLVQRVRLYTGNLFEPLFEAGLSGRADLITCNPPYISSARVRDMATEIARHEPTLAFDGGPLGIALLRRTIRDAPGLLSPGGCLLMEAGLGQGPAVMQSLQANSAFSKVEGFTDSTGTVRVIRAVRQIAI